MPLEDIRRPGKSIVREEVRKRRQFAWDRLGGREEN
jgi:hypothetical protein